MSIFFFFFFFFFFFVLVINLFDKKINDFVPFLCIVSEFIGVQST